MDHRIENARETLLKAIHEINQTGIQNKETLCNMTELIKGYHYLAEIEMLEELGAEEYEREYGRYDRMYGRGDEVRARRRGYRRNRNYGNEGDMHMYLEEQMRNAKTEQERERIRRLMDEY